MLSGSSRTVEITVLIEMTTCEFLCGNTFVSSDGEWWCMNFETTPNIPDILLGSTAPFCPTPG